MMEAFALLALGQYKYQTQRADTIEIQLFLLFQRFLATYITSYKCLSRVTYDLWRMTYHTHPVVPPLKHLDEERGPGLDVLQKRLKHVPSLVEVYQDAVLSHLVDALVDLQGAGAELLSDDVVVGRGEG